VAAARPSLFSMSPAYLVWLRGLALLAVLFTHASIAEEQKYIAQLHANTPQELADLLDRAESWVSKATTYPKYPIAVVLHGPEANVFIKHNYAQYKALVDQAAKLDAFKVVDIKICERWMGFNKINRDQLPPFVETVPFGEAEEKRLIKAGYQSF
jgi:intracellular sulfur oxidation DsrE/DsrF family protein